MPGGRNSGAVYNMYKVKYKKHKKKQQQTLTGGNTSLMGELPLPSPSAASSSSSSSPTVMSGLSAALAPSSSSTPYPLPLKYGNGGPNSLDAITNGQKAVGINILRAALTGSSEIPRQYRSYGKSGSPVKSETGVGSASSSKSSTPPSSGSGGSEEDFMVLINELIACDEFEDIATLKVKTL